MRETIEYMRYAIQDLIELSEAPGLDALKYILQMAEVEATELLRVYDLQSPDACDGVTRFFAAKRRAARDDR